MILPYGRVQMRSHRFVRVLLPSVVLGVLTAPVLAQWPQWGGPHRDFKSDVTGLANHWPEKGPNRVWSRDLGAGYSSIVVDQGKLYTMFREGEEEVVVTLDAATGKKVWDYRYPTPFLDSIEDDFGKGPRSTPLVQGDRVYTVGVTGRLHCVDRRTGKPIWSHDWVKEFGAKPPKYGFASSPIAYRNLLIAAVGGKGCGMMAFDLASGSVVWKKQDFENIYASPLIIKVDGEDQVVLLTDREIVGISPHDGHLIWHQKHLNQWKTNISTPVWGADNLLYVTSGGEAGSRALKLTRQGDKTTVQEIWTLRKMGIGQNNVIRVGDYLYGCAGYGASSYITTVNAKTGKQAWRERGFSKGQMIYADGKVIVLDENGTLTLATATPESFTVRASARVFDKKSWTIPTLVGKRLYLRDQEKILALDLG